MSIVFAIALSVLLLVTPLRLFEEMPLWVVVWATPALLFVLFRHNFLMVRQRGDNPWIAPESLVCGWVFLRYGVGALIVFFWDQWTWSLPGMERRYHVHAARDNLLFACVLSMLGGLAFYLGSRIPVGSVVRMLPDLRWPVVKEKMQLKVAVYAPIGLLVLLVLSDKLPYVLRLLGTITYALLVMFSYWWFTSSGGARARWAILTIGSCLMIGALAFSTNQSGQVFIPFLMVAFGYALAKGRMPWRFMIPAGLVGFLVVAPFLTLYKYSAETIAMENPSVDDRIQHTLRVLEDTTFQQRMELAVDRFVGRLVLTEFVSIFSAYYPNSYAYLKGESLAVEFGSLVPRFLWPDKPEMARVLNNYSVGVGIVGQLDDHTSAVFDAISEYYVNFGPVGILGLCILHALYLKIIYQWLTSSVERLSGISIHLLIFLLNFDFFGVGQLMVDHVKTIPTAILLLYVLTRSPGVRETAERLNYARA